MRKTFGIVIFALTLLPLIGFGDAFFIKAQNSLSRTGNTGYQTWMNNNNQNLTEYEKNIFINDVYCFLLYKQGGNSCVA